jgi:hypothetical protein
MGRIHVREAADGRGNFADTQDISQPANRLVNARRMPRPRAAPGHCSRSQLAGTGDLGSHSSKADILRPAPPRSAEPAR